MQALLTDSASFSASAVSSTDWNLAAITNFTDVYVLRTGLARWTRGSKKKLPLVEPMCGLWDQYAVDLGHNHTIPVYERLREHVGAAGLPGTIRRDQLPVCVEYMLLTSETVSNIYLKSSPNSPLFTVACNKGARYTTTQSKDLFSTLIIKKTNSRLPFPS